MKRRFSLFAAPTAGTIAATDTLNVMAALKNRLQQIAAHSHTNTTEKHTLFRADGRQPRPPLRLIQQQQGRVILQHCSFPDTNASLRTTSEQVLEMCCESDVGAVASFLSDCGYASTTGAIVYDVWTCRVKDCHIAVYTSDKSMFIRLSGDDEEQVLQASNLFSDLCRFEHVDNALIR
jgi:hypothetical protein